MTKEEFRNIENMTLKEVCRFLEISPLRANSQKPELY